MHEHWAKHEEAVAGPHYTQSITSIACSWGRQLTAEATPAGHLQN